MQTKTERTDGYQEFMLYGFDDNFLLEAPALYELNQKELFKLAEENGLFMYQIAKHDRESSCTNDFFVIFV